MKLKQTLLTLSIGLAVVVSAHARLSPSDFLLFKAWAEEGGFQYDGTDYYNDDFGKPIYYLRFRSMNPPSAIVLVPSNSISTLREAEVGFQASQITDLIVKKQMLDQRARELNKN